MVSFVDDLGTRNIAMLPKMLNLFDILETPGLHFSLNQISFLVRASYQFIFDYNRTSLRACWRRYEEIWIHFISIIEYELTFRFFSLSHCQQLLRICWRHGEIGVPLMFIIVDELMPRVVSHCQLNIFFNVLETFNRSFHISNGLINTLFSSDIFWIINVS